MQNSGKHSGRYAWTRVKTNRHKVNKRRDVSDAHLVGRLSLLRLDHEELGDRFPAISELIQAEMDMIEDEIALRAAGKSKPTPVVPEWESEFEGWDLNSIAEQEFAVMLEDECGN